MAATERRRSPKHPRTRTAVKTDSEALAERLDLLLKVKGGIYDKDKRFWVVEAILALASPPSPAEVTITDEMVMPGAKLLATIWPGGFEDQSGEVLSFRPNDRAKTVAKRIIEAALQLNKKG